MMMLAKWFMTQMRMLKNDKKGQAMIEYGLIIALIAVVLIGVIVVLSGGLDAVFKDAANGLKGVTG